MRPLAAVGARPRPRCEPLGQSDWRAPSESCKRWPPIWANNNEDKRKQDKPTEAAAPTMLLAQWPQVISVLAACTVANWLAAKASALLANGAREQATRCKPSGCKRMASNCDQQH